MVYNNNLAAAIMVDGKVMAEKNGAVYLPFGSEYSIYLKNNNRELRTKINILIDGTSIMNKNDGLLSLKPLESVNLQRYITSNHKFKFIEKTQEISEYRGDNVYDGTVRIKFKYEKKQSQNVPITKDNSHYWSNSWPTPYYPTFPIIYCNSKDSSGNSYKRANTVETFSCSNSQVTLDGILDGITVKGSKSNQNFVRVDDYETEDKEYEILIFLSGIFRGDLVKEFYVPKSKIICPTCGRKNKINHKFCYNCGTSLED